MENQNNGMQLEEVAKDYLREVYHSGQVVIYQVILN
jgi:hypothetical protein